MKQLRFLLTAILSCAAGIGLFFGCALGAEDESGVDYSVRVVDYLTAVGDVEPKATEAVLTKVYDDTGYQVGEVKATFDEEGLNTTTENYDVDTDGSKSLTETIVNTYEAVLYNGETIQRLLTSEAFDSSGTRQSWSEYTYNPVYLDSYETKTDYQNDDGTDLKVGYQLRTYLKNQADADKNGTYRTDQYFTYEDGVTDELKKEYAAWYDEEGVLISELYHVIRGSGDTEILPDGVDEAYYYITYSRNEAGDVYLKSSYVYDVGDRALITWEDGTDGSFVVTAADDEPFAYALEFENIKEQYDLTLSDYDGEGNLIKETMYLYGAVQNITTYDYNEDNEMTEKSIYTQGGTIIEQRIVVRFREDEIDEIPYTLRETCTYYYNEDLQPEDITGQEYDSEED